MRQILAILFCALAIFAFGQQNDIKDQNFDNVDFSKKYEVANWLFKYDRVAWVSTDSLKRYDKKELERLGKEWFCYQDQSNTWHAVYGKYDNGTYDLVFHFTADENFKVKRIYDAVDTLILNSYSRALVTANKQISDIKAKTNIGFNQFVKRNEDKTFSVWIFPGSQSNGVAVYGGEFIYTIDQSGNTILKDDSYFQGSFRGFKVENTKDIRLSYPEIDKPTLGAVFFVWYYFPYFKSIYICCSKSNSTLTKDLDNKYHWIHTVKEPENKEKD